jgi:hypothetical protein
MGDLWTLAVSSAVLCVLAAALAVTSSPVFRKAVRAAFSAESATGGGARDGADDSFSPLVLFFVRTCALFASTTVHLYLLELACLACIEPGARLADPWITTVQAVAAAFVVAVLGAWIDWVDYRDMLREATAEKQASPADDYAEDAILLTHTSEGHVSIRPLRRRPGDSSGAHIGTGLWPFLLVIQFTYLTLTLGVFGDTQTSTQAHVYGVAFGLLLAYTVLLAAVFRVLVWVARRIDAPAEGARTGPLPWIRRCDHCELLHWLRWTVFVSDAVGLWALASSILLALYLALSVSESSLALPSRWSALVQPLYLAIGFTSGTAMSVQFWSAKIERARRAPTRGLVCDY